jgi:transcriptional regulator with XRE-family HTH domain
MSKRKKTPLQRAIIQLRRNLGFTQEDLAREMSVTLPAVGHWESDARPGNIALARFAQLAQDHPVLAKVFMDELAELKETQWRKAADIFDEIGRWQKIKATMKAIGDQADKLRLVGQDDIAQTIVDRLYDLEKELAAAQRWSWRNR